MKTLLGAAALAITVVAASSVHAAQARVGGAATTLMPPAQYDVPYTGELTIWISPEATIKETCKQSSQVACARPAKNECTIWILEPLVEGKRFNLVIDGKSIVETKNGKPVANSKRLGQSYTVRESLAIVLRHELAHCHGWAADHPDARTVNVDDASIKMPTLPPSTKWLPAYPPVVCISPARKHTAEPKAIGGWQCENLTISLFKDGTMKPQTTGDFPYGNYPMEFRGTQLILKGGPPCKLFYCSNNVCAFPCETVAADQSCRKG
jgi:hypothetical protein